jgi:pyruvate dehydrogenase E1 component alpha subunit
MYDPERYRDKAEVAEWRARDPIPRSSDALRDAGLLDDDRLAALEAEADAEIAAAERAAEAAPVEDVADLLRFVTSDPGGAR